MESFLELCRNRRSYRKYTSQPVEREKLDYIVQCALMAPAGKRLNPWHFTVVTDEAVIRQFAGCRTYGSGMFQTATAALSSPSMPSTSAVTRGYLPPCAKQDTASAP